MKKILTGLCLYVFVILVFSASQSNAQHLVSLQAEHQCLSPPSSVLRAWPDSDFSRCTISFDEIISGGPGKDGIRSIENPQFASIEHTELADNESVISVTIDGMTRIYPLQILIWHEIVNDQIAGIPIAVTYCPLCNASIVFDRRLDGQVLEFGTTGNLRKSDLVMYDRQTLSWFQQFDGTGLFGRLAGKQLKILPARLESLASARARSKDSLIMQTPKRFLRPYGSNPYIGYDSSAFPFLFYGELPSDIAPLEYVVIANEKAWTLNYLKRQKILHSDDLIISWHPGRASALDTRTIAQGRDIGVVTVIQTDPNGTEKLVPYKLSFAFVWHAFHPDKKIMR